MNDLQKIVALNRKELALERERELLSKGISARYQFITTELIGRNIKLQARMTMVVSTLLIITSTLLLMITLG